MINPVIKTGTVAVTEAVYSTPQTVSIPDTVDRVAVFAVGGGGGGGGGNRYSNTRRGAQGGSTVIKLNGNNAGGSPVTEVTLTAVGGLGGYSGRNTDFYTSYHTAGKPGAAYSPTTD